MSHLEKSTHMRKKPTSDVVQTWRWQRATAVALIFLSCWFMVTLVTQLQLADPNALAQWLGHPAVALAMGVMVLAAFIHKHIGLHEIITDYIHCPCKKNFANLLLNVAVALLTLVTLAAVWHLHLVGIHS